MYVPFCAARLGAEKTESRDVAKKSNENDKKSVRVLH